MTYRTIVALSASLLMGVSGAALAQQAEHDAHHPQTPQAQEERAPASMSPSGQMPSMQDMPKECRAMMETMPQACMDAMQQMMQGGMMHGGMAAPQGGESAPADADVADFTKAYVDAMEEMHGPMMEGVMAEDPDVAFIRGMIPHHQGAVDMAKIVQRYGDDPQTREWASQIIEAQEREIAEMQAWLDRNAGQQPAGLVETGGTVYSANEGDNSISAIELGLSLIHI
mgnify:FL=1